MMSLREVKKEVDELPNIPEHVNKINTGWLRTLQHPDHSFLEDLDSATKKEVKQKINLLKNSLEEIKLGQVIHEKLKHQARQLVELKITAFNGDKNKSKILKNGLLHDEVFNIQQTIAEIQEFSYLTQKVTQHYEEIGRILEQNLCLEKSVIYQELPHKIHFKRLQEMAFKQKELVHKLGTEFLMLAKNK